MNTKWSNWRDLFKINREQIDKTEDEHRATDDELKCAQYEHPEFKKNVEDKNEPV